MKHVVVMDGARLLGAALKKQSIRLVTRLTGNDAEADIK